MAETQTDARRQSSISDDPLTLIPMGVLAVLIASLTHEFFGHGLACLAEQGRITLITLLLFRCDGATAITDGAGPVATFVVGWAILGWLLLRRPDQGQASLFGLIVAVLLVFWAPAQAVREALDGSDDWGHVARDLNWPPIWHPLTAIIGVALYLLAIRAIATAAIRLIPGRPSRLWLPYIAATLTGMLMAALWYGDPAGSALDAALTFGATPLGCLFAINAAARRPATGQPIIRNWRWPGIAAIAFVAFSLTIARGLGPLA